MLLAVNDAREPEIREHNLGVVFVGGREQDVFRLEVKVQDVVVVERVDGAHELAHDLGGVALAVAAALDDRVVQLTASAQVEDHVDLLLLFVHLVDLDEVVVSNFVGDVAQDLDFGDGGRAVLELGRVDDLDGELAAVALVGEHAHDAVAAHAKHVAHLVVLQPGQDVDAVVDGLAPLVLGLGVARAEDPWLLARTGRQRERTLVHVYDVGVGREVHTLTKLVLCSCCC